MQRDSTMPSLIPPQWLLCSLQLLHLLPSSLCLANMLMLQDPSLPGCLQEKPTLQPQASFMIFLMFDPVALFISLAVGCGTNFSDCCSGCWFLPSWLS
ncbi:ankyrin repeat-containing protein-like [Iris pallida]|uniref:Ankyrin repeat-containing protein-like n=1 Tax=Iris pallida TaxID=29817 RepID=A0AAX6FE80_IRIPA|nr:ankyrin repeat-containing protein-like [Iris pallida]